MAVEIKVKNLPGYQSIIANDKHTIVGDGFIKNNGTDLGLTSTELILGGLAMGKAARIRYVARIRGWDIS